MTLCPNCGATATPESRFCQKCGATIPAAAPPPSAPPRPHAPTQMESPALPVEGYSYQPPPPPPGAGYSPYPPQAPPPVLQQGPIYPPPVLPGYPPPAPRKRSMAPLMIVLVLVVLVGGYAGVAYWKHLWPFASSGPKEAVEQARQAYNKKDAAKFEKYVDMKSLISDVFDQMAAENAMDQATLAQVKFAMPQIADIIKSVLFGTPTTAPPEMVQAMTASSEPLRTALQKVTFQGFDGEPQTNGKESIVRVKLADTSQGAPQNRILELKLKDNGTNWQVVSAMNLKKFDPTFGANPASAGPKEAVEQARIAYQKKDPVLFDKYVDLESLVSDVYDQLGAEGVIDQPTLAQVKTNIAKITEIVKSIFFGTPTDAPPETVETIKGGLQPLRAALEKVSYQGIDSVTNQGPSDAIVKVKLADATGASTKTETMDVKVKDAGSNWKVVAVPNLTKMK